jgi:hypothetical protein
MAKETLSEPTPIECPICHANYVRGRRKTVDDGEVQFEAHYDGNEMRLETLTPVGIDDKTSGAEELEFDQFSCPTWWCPGEWMDVEALRLDMESRVRLTPIMLGSPCDECSHELREVMHVEIVKGTIVLYLRCNNCGELTRDDRALEEIMDGLTAWSRLSAKRNA